MNIQIVSLTIIIFMAISCAHHRDVRPGVEGVHTVDVLDEDIHKGARNAIRQANHFCEERGKTAAFLQEDKKYTGSMEEEKYKTAKGISKAAKVVGGGLWVFGGKRVSPIGGLAGLGGAAADEIIGDGYTVVMKFKCI